MQVDFGLANDDRTVSGRHNQTLVAADVQSDSKMIALKRCCKRGIDLSVSALALFVLLPLLALIALMVWAGDRGNPIFRHKRIGRSGRTFGCLKFRTMVTDSQAVLEQHLAEDRAARIEWAATHKLKNDPRITPVGQFLRKTSLDELPQLANVLIGQMSLVGPRPIVQAEVAHYGREFERCFSIPPGITGLWQVSGRSNCTYAERVALDLRYVTQWRLRNDLRILVMTMPAVLTQRGSC